MRYSKLIVNSKNENKQIMFTCVLIKNYVVVTINVFRYIKILFEHQMFKINYNFLMLCFINSKLIEILCKIIKKIKN